MRDPEEYRSSLTKWRAETVARASGARPLTLADQIENGRALSGAGLAGPSWPIEFGGVGGDERHEAAFHDVLGDIGDLLAPRLVTAGICAPTILEFGTSEQKATYLPDMIAGATVWTQLLSEPGAGSDLASVSTTARPVDGGWSLSGQKVWTSRADVSDFALALVRTGDNVENRRKSLSMMIVDMASSGVDVRPLREMTGEDLFNEVFLDGAFVPEENLVGELNGGWAVLLGMLRHERDAVGTASSSNTIYRSRTEDLRSRIGMLGERSRFELQHDLVRFASRELAHSSLTSAVSRVRRISDEQRPFGSLAKVSVAGLAVAASDLATRVDGMHVRAPEVDLAVSEDVDSLLRAPKAAIAGGTTEIQKNTIAKQILRLDDRTGER